MFLARKLCGVLLVGSLFLVFPTFVLAQTEPINDTYQTAKVTQILQEKRIQVDSKDYYVQEVEVQLNGADGQTLTITSGSDFQPLNENQRLRVGSQVIVSQQQIRPDESEYVINDVYRLPVIIGLIVFFCVLVISVAGKQGALSILGMVLSLGVLIIFIIPHILSGENPFLVTLFGATAAAVITMYLSHGFQRKTHIALVSMLLCLAFAAGLSTIVVMMGQFVGLGSEDAGYLQFGAAQKINLQGLLLASILLGTLGILDDITLAQTSVIEQLKDVHPKISFNELYSRGLAVGRDHVASLVNTFVFAYAGASLPLFLLFTLYRTQPTWVVINSEIIAEEIIRTVVGSIALVMAVPITTAIASYMVTKKTIKAAAAKPS